MKRFAVYVTSKEGIFDPAGENSRKALESLGFSGVTDLAIGKYIELEVEDSITEEEVAKMCEKLLTNPVIEDYKIKEL